MEKYFKELYNFNLFLFDCLRLSKNIYMCMCVYVCTYIHVYRYTHTHTHTS